MHEITLEIPIVRGQSVTFAWNVRPATELYRQTEFTLRFPETVDLSLVPGKLWWTLALFCLHPHWLLLRPCRIHLPVQLPDGERTTWLNLMEARIATLEAHRGSNDYERRIELIDEGPELEASQPIDDQGHCATAFSGGKDSLLQVGLLTEATERVTLVTTTSPRPGTYSHSTSRRRDVLRQIVARRDVRLIDVRSDYRQIYDNRFPRRLGYPVSLNVLSDMQIYASALIAAATALGVNHLFLASETETQGNVLLGGRVIEKRDCGFAITTHRVLQALLETHGIFFTSLIAPLFSHHVLQLLWKRYGDLSDLQYSCWRLQGDQAACSQCDDCLRIAFIALSLRQPPSRVGIDLPTLMNHYAQWRPKSPVESTLPIDHLYHHRSAAHFIQQCSRIDLYKSISRARPQRWLSGDVPRALRQARTFKRRIDSLGVPEMPGYRPLFLRYVDPLVRDRVGEIYDGHFTAEDAAEYAAVVERADELTEWIVKPLRERLTTVPTGHVVAAV